MTRVETFADAAFAFAVTLLVISVDHVPRTFDELIVALKSVPIFVFASAQIFIFWTAHRNWSRVYGIDDHVAVILTLLLVVSLLVMVFPLRIVYGFGASDITNGWIPASFPLDREIWVDQIRLVFIVFGVSWGWLSGVVVAMFVYALKKQDDLDVNEAELDNANTYIWVFATLGFAGISSIVIATFVPGEWVKLAGYQYFLLVLLVFWRLFKKITRTRRVQS